MKKRLFQFFDSTILEIIVITVFLAGYAFAQNDSNNVQISDPTRDGIEVKKGMTVKGTANIPSGYHVWILVRRIDFEGFWWPQNEGKIDPRSHDWKVFVTIGQEQDIGWEFDIIAIVVNEKDHIELKNYRKKAMLTGDWRPIESPSSLCSPQVRTVKKVSHD